MPSACCLVAVFLAPAGCSAQIFKAEEQVADAQLDSAEELRGAARIFGYDDAGGLVTISEGTNDLT